MLQVRDLRVSYGSIEVIKNVSLEVNEGEIVALLGSNGAGKTTTVKTIMGLMTPGSGTITYLGNSISDYATHEIVSKGLVMVPEGRQLFPQMTVKENLLMGAYSKRDKKGISNNLDFVFTLFPRLKERIAQSAGTLSGGEQQMLTIGRALMSNPEAIILDEPSLGLAPVFVKEIFNLIKEINGMGKTILLIEQNARLALEIAHRAYVLENGRISLWGEAKDLLNNPEVKKAYLGGE